MLTEKWAISTISKEITDFLIGLQANLGKIYEKKSPYEIHLGVYIQMDINRPQMRMQIAVLIDAVNNSIHVPFIYIYSINFTKMMSFWIKYMLCLY